MKKTTLKITTFLLLTMFAIQVQGQALWTEPGVYKISTSGLTPNLYLTISTTTGDLVWDAEITPDDATQLWTVTDHRMPASAGYVEITADITPGPGAFTMIVDQSTIAVDPVTGLFDQNDKDFRISVRPGLPISDTADPNYGFDQFQRRKAKVGPDGLADPNGTNPADGNNALFVKPEGATGASRYGVIPTAAGEDVLFDGGGIDVLQYHLISALSTADFDTSSIFVSNPVNDELTIKGLTPNVKDVNIYSLLGKQIMSIKVDGASTLNMDVSTLASGLYIVKMVGDNGSYSKKIIKE